MNKGVLLVTLMLLLGACSQKSQEETEETATVAPVTQVSKEERVAKRVLERMDALIDMDWKRAYQYLSPATKKVLSYRVFANRMGVSAIVRDEASIRSIECEEEVCDVRVNLTYTYVGGVIDAMQGKQMHSVVEEKWIFADGDWWYVWE